MDVLYLTHVSIFLALQNNVVVITGISDVELHVQGLVLCLKIRRWIVTFKYVNWKAVTNYMGI